MSSFGGLDTGGSPAFTGEEAARYRAAGWWSNITLSGAVAVNAAQHPDRPAYIDSPGGLVTWHEFDYAATVLAEQLAGVGVSPGDRIGVWHRDAAAIHVLFIAVERCGAVAVGIGARAGTCEVAAILRSARPKLVVSDAARSDDAARAVAAVADYSAAVIVLTQTGGAPRLNLGAASAALRSGRLLGPDDVFLVNSTSGTTGLPKCVVHTQNRWFYFHQKAVANGHLTADDVFLPVIPMPFGFAIWTSHTTPIFLGSTAVILDRFNARATCEAIATHQVTVLCCVSTQLTMMTADSALREHDLSSLRVVFTGGESLPRRAAEEFEEVTGAPILQFYGSNETGLLSATTLEDSQPRRLRTGGRVVPEMAVRLFDGDRDVTACGRGQPACRGPATSLGYLDGSDHHTLFTRDGWMRMGDICDIDRDGYLTVTGRASDFILRGGKNISAAQVEDAATTHPAVAVAAAVAMPDPVFGEKVCLYAELIDAQAVDLPGLIEFLLAAGVSKELLPERLIVVDELPRSSGGKIAKGRLRDDLRVRLHAAGADQTVS